MGETLPHNRTWLGALLHEMFSMPRRHVFVFLIATVILMVLEVEFTEGWHLIHILEVLGAMGFLYFLWAATLTLGTLVGAGVYTFVYARGGSYLTDKPEACVN